MHRALAMRIARQVREAGITRIEGGIIGDDDLFDDKPVRRRLDARQPAVRLLGGRERARVQRRLGRSRHSRGRRRRRSGRRFRCARMAAGLQVDNRLVTVAESGTGRLTLHRLPGSSRVVVHGQIPAKAAPFARTASVDNPTTFFVSAFRDALIAEGIEVNGDAVDIDDFLAKPDLSAARTLVSHQSPPLRQIAASMMKVSQNQYAETLLKALGGQRARGQEACLQGLERRRRQLRHCRWIRVVAVQLRHVRRARAHSPADARRPEARLGVRRNASCRRTRRNAVEDGSREPRPRAG